MRPMAVTRKVAALVAATLVACGGTSASTRDRGGETEVDAKDASKAARGLIQEIYGDLRRGDVSGVQSLVSPDVFVVGPGAPDVFSTRSDAVVALGSVLRSGDRHRITSRALKVSAAPGGHSAWASDALDVDGVTYSLTSVLVESDGLWNVVAVHVGRTLSGQQLDARPPARADLPGGVGKGAGEPLKLYRAGVAAPERFVEQLGGGPDVLVLGAGARDVVRGAKLVKKLWKKRLAAQPKMILDGDPRADVTPDGSLAWVFANVDVRVQGGAAEPYRSLVIYEREDGGWKLIAMHDSVAFGNK